jgi:hypothetical protein
MIKSLALMGLIVAGGTLAGCIGGSNCRIPTGTAIAVSRAGGTGACPAAVVAGVLSLNGIESFTPVNGASCGVTHFTLNVTFSAQAPVTCTGSDVIAFEDLQLDGGTGTDTMTITCSDSTSCSEAFDVTFTPQ